MSKRTYFLTLFLWLTAVTFPAFAQQKPDTVHVLKTTAAFDLPWLAKCYGLDWSRTGRSVSGQADNAVSDGFSETKSDMSSDPDLKTYDSYTLSLRANLLRIEWRISPSWGIMVNGSWTSWSWNNADRRYALWEVAPEVRWYLGEKKAWYVGAMFKAGQFNYKFSGTGRQGDLLGGGITGGYQLRLNKALALDFTLGLGYLNADTERYDVIDGVRVRSGNETKHWIGPINAGVTLVWKLL